MGISSLLGLGGGKSASSKKFHIRSRQHLESATKGVSGQYLKNKVGKIRFKDKEIAGLELRKELGKMLKKRGYIKEDSFMEDLRKAGVKYDERDKLKRVLRAKFSKPEPVGLSEKRKQAILSMTAAQYEIERGREEDMSNKLLNRRTGKSSVENVLTKDNVKIGHSALGIKGRKYGISVQGDAYSEDDELNTSKTSIGQKGAKLVAGGFGVKMKPSPSTGGNRTEKRMIGL